MKRARIWLIAFVAALVFVPGTDAQEPPAPKPEGGRTAQRAGWRQDPVWDDGKAEFAVYEVAWPRYGRLWPGRAVLVLVKEPWDAEEDVKSEHPERAAFDVLKLNHIRDVPTGIYTYHQMASVFIRRGDGALRKLTATSSEACGLSTAAMTDGRLDVRTYWEGQAHQELPWPEGAVPEDALPALLRPGGRLPEELMVFPSLMDSRHASLKPEAYRVSRQKVEVEVPAGAFHGERIRLEAEDGDWMSYVFSGERPYPLVQLERSDGTSYRLAKLGRIAYWEMHEPGAEGWIPEELR